MSLRSLFDIDARGSSVSREVRGAFATILTMSYILVVNADILAGARISKRRFPPSSPS